MSTPKAMSLKAQINQYAKKNNIAAQVVLQNYMFERFLARLTVSDYCDKFVIKGGVLIAAIVGLDTRSTMDLDATLHNFLLSEETIGKAMQDICAHDLEDDIYFESVSILPIRKDDVYGGYRVRLDAKFDTITTPLSIDISAGDAMTPSPVQYEFGGLFDDSKIKLWAYNLETVLAEKVETVLRRGVLNTRARDFYDIYVLTKSQNYDPDIFIKAFAATAKYRGSSELIKNPQQILEQILQNDDMQDLWQKYSLKFAYAKDIAFDSVMKAVWEVVEILL